ncbi:MAG: hypothetical protein HF967_05680 [Methanosarcinales archaeon]|nr:hypothetical protein [Methanosarcinales archaeon]
MNQEKIKFHSIEYISYKQEIIIDEKNNNKLSPFSLSILDSALSKKITIIFSQGNFNLSPIISGIHTIQQKSDVLIGIPKTSFNNIFKKNTDVYFSLMYKKLIDSVPSSSFYFYHDTLWCKGSINKETDELSNVDTDTRPKHGSRRFKKDYGLNSIKNLRNGKYQQIPKIVSMPIDSITSIIGEKSIKFKKENYKLNKFNPKLIIYESINERIYNFDILLKLINEFEKSNGKLILHFSWPYLNGLSKFLTEINDNDNINLFHLGKRYCIESKNEFKKPASNLISLSLEGELWDRYYQNEKLINFEIILPALSINDNNLSTKNIEFYDWQFDDRVYDIKEYLKYENIDKIEKNVLKFPPIFDNFLSPSEIKRKCKKNKEWMTLPIRDSFSTNKNEISHSVCIFKGLCSDLDKCKDISYEFRGLYTTSTISKKTLFQIFIIERINQFCNINSAISKSKKTNLIVVNLHPYLATTSSFPELIKYLIESMQNIIGKITFPKIMNENNTISIGIKHNIESIIFKDGTIQESCIKIIRRNFYKDNPDFDLHIFKKDKSLRLIIKTKDTIKYLKFDGKNSSTTKKNYNGLILYDAIVKNNGSFIENKISKISFDKTYKDLTIKADIEYRTDKNKDKNNCELNILYTKLSKIQELPQELVQYSELLIPGPIPFFTTSGEDILISQGYDALLLPFKKLVFFAYPGHNFKRLLYQIKSYDDLISNNESNIAKKDLSFSIDYTNKSNRFKMPTKSHINNSQKKKFEMDAEFDSVFRQELLNDSNIDKSEREEIKTLEYTWNAIQKSINQQSQPNSFKYQFSKERIEFCVEFETGIKDTISFSVGTLIRKNMGNDYILASVENLSEGDQVFYIGSDERESIENYLLRTVHMEEEFSLEKILEPLTALKIFYETINSINFRKEYDENQMKKIYWLSMDQKKKLFNLLTHLLNDNYSLSEEGQNSLILNSIWKNIKSEKLIEIFGEGNKKLTQIKLFNLAKEMDLNYEKSSFKVLCTTAINNQPHYSFHDEKNLLAIGCLIGHKDIIDNHQTINEKGEKIGTFLRQIGKSIKRVANGNGELLNDIDMNIEGKIEKCKIIKIGKC